MKPLLLKSLLILFLSGITCFIQGQDKPLRGEPAPRTQTAKPFKVLTNGRQITIQCKQNLKRVMVWTSGGHRFIEEKDLNIRNYSFAAPPKENIFFMMIETAEGKRFTEKIGVQ